MSKRVFLIVMDSVGIGELPDADKFGDKGTHTLRACCTSDKLSIPNLTKLGIFNIDNIGCGEKADNPMGSYSRMAEKSMGKDTTIGHWEIAGVISENPLPTYPDGFPEEVIKEFEEKTGRKAAVNAPYSGTKLLEDWGEHHLKTGDLLVYTSADSVFQIAAHEDIVPVEELYKYCKIAREILKEKHGVGRVIARPFIGEPGNFTRTSNRHDYSLLPPQKTMCDYLKENNKDVIGVGKIYDIFAGQGITESLGTNKDNADGMNKSIKLLDKDFEGLCFINLVDFDMKFGHRNDIDGYANSLTEFDAQLGEFLGKIKEDDILIVTADHGCDPSYTKTTDHSREYAPMIIYGDKIRANINLGTRDTFADIAKTVLDYFNVDNSLSGRSFLKEVSSSL